jgi:2-amino-4-hydroxy-6-hydroxymethyldihydropteridine diphosphokinase
MIRCFIGLGSNLEQPQEQVLQACKALGELPDSQLLAVSSLYSSKPVGPQDQPDFINAVAIIETRLTPEALLDQLQQQEHHQGRVRRRHWGERTIDLDILLYGDQILNTERLIIPHAELHQRSFVVIPMLELAPELVLPGGLPLQQYPSSDDPALIRLSSTVIDL